MTRLGYWWARRLQRKFGSLLLEWWNKRVALTLMQKRPCPQDLEERRPWRVRELSALWENFISFHLIYYLSNASSVRGAITQGPGAGESSSALCEMQLTSLQIKAILCPMRWPRDIILRADRLKEELSRSLWGKNMSAPTLQQITLLKYIFPPSR